MCDGRDWSATRRWCDWKCMSMVGVRRHLGCGRAAPSAGTLASLTAARQASTCLHGVSARMQAHPWTCRHMHRLGLADDEVYQIKAAACLHACTCSAAQTQLSEYLETHQPQHLQWWLQLCQACAQTRCARQHHAPAQVPQRRWHGPPVSRRPPALSDQRHVTWKQPRPQQRACPQSSPAPAGLSRLAS